MVIERSHQSVPMYEMGKHEAKQAQPRLESRQKKDLSQIIQRQKSVTLGFS